MQKTEPNVQPEIEQPDTAMRDDTTIRVADLNRNEKPYHIVLAQQFDRHSIEQLCQLSDMIRAISV